MPSKQQFHKLLSHTILGPAAIAMALTLALTVGLIQPMQAQTFEVLYNFTSGQAGGFPGSLVMDKAGSLYGTTGDGGYSGGDCYRFGGWCGTVFKLSIKAPDGF